MYKSTQTLIQEMVEDLQPVRALRLRSGLLLLLAAVGLTVLGIALLSGLWAGVWQPRQSGPSKLVGVRYRPYVLLRRHLRLVNGGLTAACRQSTRIGPAICC